MITKLRNRLKFTSAIVTTTLLFFQTQSVFGADTTVSTATTSNITLATDDDVVINLGGSVATTANNSLQVSGTNTTISNNGSISSNVTGTGSATLGNAIGNAGTIVLLENNGDISSTVSTTGDGGNGIVNSLTGTITSFINTGSITGNNRDGIDQLGIITTLTNSGTIRGIQFDGINNDDGADTGQATITTLTNSGTIRGARHGIGQDDGKITNLTNSGTILGDNTAGIYSGAFGIITTLENSGNITGGTYGIRNNGGTLTTLTNSGTISGGTNSILNTGTLGSINLNKGSILIGTINSSTDTTLNMNVGASKSYAYQTEGAGTITLNDLDNRPSIAGSAYAVNIGSMEMAGENLNQKTANITDAIDRNVKNNKDTWVEPYYSESTRDSGGNSSQIRQFKNNKQGVNAGFKVENSATPLQVIFNVDQTKNNIDSSEHVINGDGVMIGLVAPSYAKYEGIDVSVKGLVGYASNKTDRKILDNTSSTGERTLTGKYNSYNAVIGLALSKNYNLAKDLNNNLTLGVDLTSEFRDSYSENLYFKYNSLDLVQLQPRIQSEYIKTIGKDSNVFLTAGVGAREILSGKTQKYSMNNTGVTFTAPNSGDYYASIAAGTNMNVAAKVNFYTLVSAKMSDRDAETYQASIGLKGTF